VGIASSSRALVRGHGLVEGTALAQALVERPGTALGVEEGDRDALRGHGILQVARVADERPPGPKFLCRDRVTGNLALSTRSTLYPRRAKSIAVGAPAQRAPTTMTS
jgi:hypothetical protein